MVNGAGITTVVVVTCGTTGANEVVVEAEVEDVGGNGARVDGTGAGPDVVGSGIVVVVLVVDVVCGSPTG